MTPAIWTAIPEGDSLPEALRFLRGCGWECFELSTEHLTEIADDPQPARRVEATRRILDELGAIMPQAHAHLPANVAHPDARRRSADIDLLLRHLECCADLGVRDVVIHAGAETYTTRDDLRRIAALNVDAFSRLADRAGELGLRIGIENSLGGRGAHHRFGALVSELLDVVGAVGSPALGITFDTSHANVGGLNLPTAIEECGSHLFCTHISDNNGSGDQHLTPGSGTIDWPAVMAALRGIRYDGLLNLEIPGENHPVRELVGMKLRHARAVADWLVGLAGV